MAMLRTVICSVCGKRETEETHGKGWTGWLWIQGASLDGDSQIWLCPEHMERVMNFIDEMKHGKIKLAEK